MRRSLSLSSLLSLLTIVTPIIINRSIRMSSSSSSSSSRGIFILFEGVDRCGKSTQASLLASHLASLPLPPPSSSSSSTTASSSSELIRFPDRTSAIGQLINSYLTSVSDLSDRTIHLLFSANRWEASSSLEKKLLNGTSLVCDRYAYSGVAFTSAKGLNINWCKSCDIGLPAPDAIIYLDITPENAALRGNYGEERYEKIDFQIKVREKFMLLKEEDEGKLPWYVLDATKSIDELQKEIQIIANKVLEDNKHKEIKSLWT